MTLLTQQNFVKCHGARYLHFSKQRGNTIFVTRLTSTDRPMSYSDRMRMQLAPFCSRTQSYCSWRSLTGGRATRRVVTMLPASARSRRTRWPIGELRQQATARAAPPPPISRATVPRVAWRSPGSAGTRHMPPSCGYLTAYDPQQQANALADWTIVGPRQRTAGLCRFPDSVDVRVALCTFLE